MSSLDKYWGLSGILRKDVARPPDLGLVLQKEIGGSVYTLHFYIVRELYGPFVRVYRGEQICESSLIIDCHGFGYRAAIREGGWKKVGIQDPGPQTLGPALYFEPPYPQEWFLMEKDKLRKLGRTVPPELQHLEMLQISNYQLLEERLLTGINRYSYEMWLEYKRLYAR